MTNKKIAAMASLLFVVTVFLFNNCSQHNDTVFESLAPKTVTRASIAISGVVPLNGTLPVPFNPSSANTSAPELKGYFDAVYGDVVLGWVCLVNVNQSARVNIKVDGVQIADFLTAGDSEPAISKPEYCNNNYQKHRFAFRIPEAQYGALNGKVIKAYAVNPLDISRIAEISSGGIVYHVGDYPLWYTRLPAGTIGSAPSRPAPVLKGFWDAFVTNNDGSVSVSGWACVVGYPASVSVSILTTENVFIQSTKTTILSAASEAATINSMCQSTWSYRRFYSTIPANIANAFKTKTLKIVLSEPFVAGVNYDELGKSNPFTATIGATTNTGGGGTTTGGGGTGGGTDGGGTVATGDGTCPVLKVTERCATNEVCGNTGEQVGWPGVISITFTYNISRMPDQGMIGISPGVATATDTSIKLTGISGVSYMCNRTSTTTAAWTSLYLFSSCHATKTLPATDPRCQPPPPADNSGG